MKILTAKEELREVVDGLKSENKTIGLVPTMGALHRGHLSLVERAVAQNNITIVSVFVNPTQFNNPDDLRSYPRTLDADISLLEKAGCKYVFAPKVEDIYTSDELGSPFQFDFEGLDKVMEGRFRPNHFNGVVQIVGKLFELASPDRAYFGEKDFQQLAIIRLITKRYHPSVEIVACPIVREDSGLAMSSRNMLLSDSQRKVASHIYAVLAEGRQFVPNTPVAELKECTIAAIEQKPELKVEYFEIVDGNTLQNIEKWDDASYIVGCITVYCGKVRLIDNICYKNIG